MIFENKLISGQFIKRYKRFFVDIKIKRKTITAHCPNTGSMMGLLKKGNKVWLSKSNNPNRKLKYTLELIEDNKIKIGVNTHSSNKIIKKALEDNMIREFKNIIKIKPETKFGPNTRFDFFVTNKNDKIFIEVKNVTLSRKKGLAEFPDAITSRGLKHIKELLKASKRDYKIYIIYLIQRNDCKFFSIAKDIDPEYASELSKAVKNKLKILCYDCKFSSKGIKLNNQISFINDDQ